MLVILLSTRQGQAPWGVSGFLAETREVIWAYDSHVTVVRPSSGNHPKFMFYAFQMPAFQQQIDNFCTTGSTNQIELSREALKDVVIDLPAEKQEQIRIAEVLTEIDKAITQTEVLIAKYGRVRTGLMQDLLTKGIDEQGRIRSETTHEFKNSPLGRIPLEWQICELGSLCNLTSGGTPSRSEPSFWGGKIPWVKTGEINYTPISKTEETITELGLQRSSTKLIPRGTLLMAIYGEGVTRGKVAVLEIDAAINQACLAFFPKESLNTDFLYFYFAHNYKALRRISNEGSQKNLSGKLMSVVQIPLPTPEEQNRVIASLQRLSANTEVEQQNLEKLQRLKMGLMQDLLTGKKSVDALLEATSNTLEAAS